MFQQIIHFISIFSVAKCVDQSNSSAEPADAAIDDLNSTINDEWKPKWNVSEKFDDSKYNYFYGNLSKLLTTLFNDYDPTVSAVYTLCRFSNFMEEAKNVWMIFFAEFQENSKYNQLDKIDF